MKAPTISIALAPSLLVFAATLSAATLEWKFTSGDEQNYRLTQSSRLTNGANAERNQVATVEQVLDLTWKVLEVSEAGEARISLEVTSLSLLAKGPDGQEVRYDSDSSQDPQGYAAMLAPIGKRLAESPITFSLNSLGVVSDVQLPEDLAEAVKSVPGGKKFAGDGGLASFETLARLGAPLDPPESEVTAEQTWSSKRKVDVPVLGSTEVKFTYKIASPVSDDEITIEQQMALVPASDEQVTRFANQKSTGTIVWDAAAGRPETSLLNFEVEFEQTANAEGRLKLEQNTEFRRIADESQ